MRSKQRKKHNKLRTMRIAKRPYLGNRRLIPGNGKKTYLKSLKIINIRKWKNSKRETSVHSGSISVTYSATFRENIQRRQNATCKILQIKDLDDYQEYHTNRKERG